MQAAMQMMGAPGRPLARRRIQALVRALRAGEITMDQFRSGLVNAMQLGMFSSGDTNQLFPALPKGPMPAPMVPEMPGMPMEGPPPPPMEGPPVEEDPDAGSKVN